MIRFGYALRLMLRGANRKISVAFLSIPFNLIQGGDLCNSWRAPAKNPKLLSLHPCSFGNFFRFQGADVIGFIVRFYEKKRANFYKSRINYHLNKTKELQMTNSTIQMKVEPCRTC